MRATFKQLAGHWCKWPELYARRALVCCQQSWCRSSTTETASSILVEGYSRSLSIALGLFIAALLFPCRKKAHLSALATERNWSIVQKSLGCTGCTGCTGVSHKYDWNLRMCGNLFLVLLRLQCANMPGNSQCRPCYFAHRIGGLNCG